MNIHPLFVHFPIALLVVYSILELGAVALSALSRQTWLFSVKTFLLFAGALAAIAAFITGDIAEDLIQSAGSLNDVLETHSAFAGATTLIYFVLAAAYLVRLFDREGWWDPIVGKNQLLARIWTAKKYAAHLILDTWILPLLALAGLVCITITGALGASIVYGPDIDPFVSFIYHLFWAQ